MKKEYNFTADELEAQISSLEEKGITELSIHDQSISKDKKRILKILQKISQAAPNLFLSLLIDASVIDKETVNAASQLFCSFEIPLLCSKKGGKLLFDKKFYANKARLLNDYGLVFGFQLSYSLDEGDTFKNFTDRLDFALQQYPNHIDFPQTENTEDGNQAKVTGIFSAQEIRSARDIAFACRSFYSAGRAVPWFLSVLKPLKIYPSRFFADFAEWQRCNNCDFKSGFIPENENHKAIEKMQLLFLEEKYEEKGQHSLILLVNNLVSLNGAMSRLAGENEESTIKLSYHPDDLFSPEIFDLAEFSENVCMEDCSVRIFAGEEGPDYEVI
ncbi:MAG: hypothetical protein K5829_14710 [Treponema sp.]|nr:hypothetical protein [Treponema sp.]